MIQALRRVLAPQRQHVSLSYNLRTHEAKGLLSAWIHSSSPRESALTTPLRANEDYELSIEHLLGTRSSLSLRDGRSLSYAFYGAPLRGSAQRPERVVLYIHGGFSSRIEPALLGLKAEGMATSIVAIDRPGAGHSSFNHVGSFESLAGDVKALLDHLELTRVVLMGVSGGCPFAAACAALLPERVDGLLLVCPLVPLHGSLGNAEHLAEGMDPRFKRLLDISYRTPWAARLQLFIMRQVIFSPWLMKIWTRWSMPTAAQAAQADPFAAEMLLASIREGLRQGVQGVAHDLCLFAGRRPWETLLEAICCPTVVWCGEQDITTPPAMARHYARRIGSAARLHLLPGENHLSLPFTHADAIIRSISTPGR